MSRLHRFVSALTLAAFLLPAFSQRSQPAPQPTPQNPPAQQQQQPKPKPKCTDNGTYVNSKGETVKRPENCSTAPQGATAQCRDGTYSFSQSHRGTCSHHGGVAKWL
jgi:Protein of unknown function (DUF3761)